MLPALLLQLHNCVGHFPQRILDIQAGHRHALGQLLHLLGHHREASARLAGTRSLNDCIHMPGFVPNDRLARYMTDLDALVVPSVVHTNGDRDGIPNVIMEALSVGMPVIATDVCGIGEVIRNGESGILAPQRNPSALANAIRYILEHASEALEMGKNGQKLVGEMFDAEKNALSLKKLYLDALCHAEEAAP